MRKFSQACIITVLAIAVFIIGYDGRFLRSQYNNLNWDAYSYYLYLPATFIHGTPFRFDFHKRDFEQYPISSSVYQFHTYGEKQAPFFTMGVAICEMPFFLTAHLINISFLNYPPDGLSLPYQLAILAAALSFLGMGLFFLRQLLLPFIGETATGITLLAIGLGTNLLYYSIYDAGLSHVYLFGLYAFLLYKTLQWHQRPRSITAAWIGAIIALLCLVRPSELVAALLPLLFGVYNTQTLREKWGLVSSNGRHLLYAAAAGVLVVLPQLLYWKLATGHFVVNAYADRGDFFDFTTPHLREGLIGYRKGWLVYTPVMAFALIGFGFLWQRQRAWFWPVLTYVALNFYLLMCYHMWHFASCFGNRALIQSYAALALPLGACIAAMLRPWKGILASLMLGCILLNLFQTWQYVKGILPFDNITKAYYWRVWGLTQPDLALRKYLQLKEYLPDLKDYQAVELKKMEQQPLPTIGENPYSNGVVLEMDARQSAVLSDQWVMFKGLVYCSSDQATEGNGAKAVLSVGRDGKDLQWTAIDMQQCYRPHQWNEVTYEVHLPDSLRAGDYIKAYIWSQSPDTIWVKSIGVNALTPPK